MGAGLGESAGAYAVVIAFRLYWSSVFDYIKPQLLAQMHDALDDFSVRYPAQVVELFPLRLPVACEFGGRE